MPAPVLAAGDLGKSLGLTAGALEPSYREGVSHACRQQSIVKRQFASQDVRDDCKEMIMQQWCARWSAFDDGDAQ